MVISTACLNPCTSNCPLDVRYFIKFREARLHAVSSRNMYSLQGLLALMRAVFLLVCQRLTVVSYCIPGSPHCQGASEIFPIKSLALKVLTTRPSTIDLVEKSLSRLTATMKSLGARTELLAF